MKIITLMLLSCLSASCSDVNSEKKITTNENKVNKTVVENLDSIPSAKGKVNKAITLAKKNKDYRFLATSGRSTSIPGVNMTDFQVLVELCGKKYNPTTGDVITSSQQRIERNKQLDFMREYNEQMLVFCRESQEK